MFGFYKRKFLLFVVFVVGLAVYFVASQTYRADTMTGNPASTSTSAIVTAELKENGDISIDGSVVKNGVNFLEYSDEVRLPIIDNPGRYYNNVTINLILPKDIASSSSYEILAIHGVGATSASVKNSNTIVYRASEVAPTGVISIVAQLPKGTLTPTVTRQIKDSVAGVKEQIWLIIALILPAITLIFTIYFILKQLRHQHIDQPDKESPAPPMAIPPAIVGALYHQNVGPREIAATIIDLAQRGDIVILDRDRDFAFGKGRFDQRLLGFEKVLLSKIFRNNMTSDMAEIDKRINNHFYSKKISIVTAGIYALATRLGYFKVNPQKIHSRYRFFGISAFFVGLGCFILSLAIFTDPPYVAFFWVGMMVAALIVTFTAGNIPIRTTIGQEVMTNWLAFRKFLTNPETFPFAENNQEIFQKYLPYAIVLDCETTWARRFSSHSFMLPTWFMTEKHGLGLEDFCLTLFPIISYVGRSLSALKEPGFE